MKYLIIISLFLFFADLNAQIEEIHDEKTAARSKDLDLSIIKKFKFTSEINDTVTIKVINPRGELIQLIAREFPMAAWESMYFVHDGSAYFPGNYQIIVEGKEGRRFARRMIINREESFRKKS